MHTKQPPNTVQSVWIGLEHTNWKMLAQAVKEQLALRWHLEAGTWTPNKVRLVVSLRILPDALATAGTRHPQALLRWLSHQCQQIEITASRKLEHRLYLE